MQVVCFLTIPPMRPICTVINVEYHGIEPNHHDKSDNNMETNNFDKFYYK